ncbi:alpha/beta fold hydrolase [Gulosibacter faecalis]|uniref:Alpha/beta fold hydrolase n=1 Tax=Gulosibacter faecalis TaxID=272240 RepID=A0ABW5UZA9_9MICO|nr:alpha/beta fold hydrolase [Gulosibacter faecalis]
MRPNNPLEHELAAIPSHRFDLDLDGALTAVWTYGPERAATTIVLVHGFRGTHHGLLNLVAALPEVRFIAPDLPGFGESAPFAGEHTLDAYAAWLGRLLDAVDPHREAIVLGHSFGSLVVARSVRALAPRQIVLVNPIAENALSGPERVPTMFAVGYYRLGAALPEPLGNALLRAPVITRVMSEVMAETKHRALRSWIHDEHDAHFSDFVSRRALLEAFRASVSDDVSSHAAEFPRGVHLVVGERDRIAPLPTSKRLHAAMPGSTLHIIEGVGHLVHYETPLALARILSQMLADAAAAEPESEERSRT